MWSAAILAGGHARRFGGKDKGALVIDGRPILERQLEEISKITTDILMVGGRGDAAGRARLIGDRVPECGPLGGLHAALSESQTDATFVIACDMPFVSATLMLHLLELTREADAVVPRTDRGFHPLCAAYTRGCLQAIVARLATMRLKMVDLLEDVTLRVVTTNEIEAFGDHRRLLANVNTPADYRGLEAVQGHQL